MKVSVVIPCFNRYIQLENTLETLRNQTYKNFEAIIIDDASEDEVSSIKLDRNFTLIQNQMNVGLAQTRNIGIRHSSGDLIIFLDAEMLIKPDYIENHVNLQNSIDNMVLTGSMYYYSIGRRAQKYARANNIKPFTEDFEKLVQRKDYFVKHILTHYGNQMEELQIPWIACMAGNLSVKKKLLDQSGWFDSSFKGYGWEDWELGYRLHQCGAKFCVDPSVACIHQEHVIGKNKGKETVENYQYFRAKHACMEVDALSLELMETGLTLKDVNDFLTAYKQLQNDEVKRAISELVGFHAHSISKKDQYLYNRTCKIISEQIPFGILRRVYLTLEELYF